MDLTMKGLLLMVIFTLVRKVAASPIETPVFWTPKSAPEARDNNIDTNTSSSNGVSPVSATPESRNGLSLEEYNFFVPFQRKPIRFHRNNTLDPLSKYYPWHQPIQELAMWSVPLTIYVIGSYLPIVNGSSSPKYQMYAAAFKNKLVQIYEKYHGFQGLRITRFLESSNACKITLKGNYEFMTMVFENKDIDYRDVNITVDNKQFSVDYNRTASTLVTETLKSLQEGRWCSALQNVCPYDTWCSWDNTFGLGCIYKCAIKNPCLHNGECYVNTTGTVKCRCREGFKGDTCEEKLFTFFSTDNTLIFNACILVVITGLILLIVWLIARDRLRQTTKQNSSTLSGIAEVHRNPSRVDNENTDISVETSRGQRQIPEQQHQMYPVPKLYPRLTENDRTAREPVVNERHIPRQGRLLYQDQQMPKYWTGYNQAAEEFVQNRYRY